MLPNLLNELCMSSTACSAAIVFTLLLTPLLETVTVARQCSAEQGQIYINEGRYRDAIREFTCLIEAQPAAVEGYRGRSEAELLLGRYSDAFREYARITAF